MIELRAFVGHSFSPEDEVVVQEFLKFFRTLQDGVMPFVWEHARQAESRELADKVLEKISGKNIFIGICTKKEKVVKSETKGLFPGFNKYQFEWKTSDWLIQEIGLAIGRGLRLILLVEQDVRLPGSLQGNINFIPFDRSQPHQCFTQIIEMLKSITPQQLAQTVAASESTIEPGTPEPPQANGEDRWSNPRPDWEEFDYRVAMISAIIYEDGQKQRQIDDHYMASRFARDEQTVAGWRAAIEYNKIHHGKGGQISRIEQLRDKYPDSYKVMQYLARAHTHFGNHKEAGRLHEGAANVAKTAESCIESLRDAAVCYSAAGMQATVDKLADTIRDKAKEAQSEALALRPLEAIYSERKLPIFAIALRERIIEEFPDSHTDRFDLAYAHSNDGDQELALLHYLNIPEADRTGLAHNNLGVLFSRFNLSARAIDSLKKARSMDETLAMSNLASHYLNAGLLEEAQAECEKAIRIPNFHKNVGLMITKMAEAPDKEEEKVKEIVARAQPKVEFMKQFGRACAQPAPQEIASTWLHPKYGTLNLTRLMNTLTATGSYKRHANVSNALLGVSSTVFSADKLVNVTLTGTLLGCAAQCLVSIDDGTAKGASLLGALDGSELLLMYLDQDEATWHILERPFSTTSSFTELKMS